MTSPVRELSHRYAADHEGASTYREHNDAGTDECLPVTPLHLMEIRDKVFDCYVNILISKELSEWLEELGLPFTGTVGEKLARLKQHARSITWVAENPHRQTIFYLSQYSAEILREICQEFGLNSEGSAQVLFRRVYDEVGRREGWFQPISHDTRLILEQMFFPIMKGFDTELWDSMSSLLREDDLFVAAPLGAYGSAFIVVLIPELLRQAYADMLKDELRLE